MAAVKPLRDFVVDMTRLAETEALHDEAALFKLATPLMRDLIRDRGWIPQAFAEPGERYRQYLLYCDPLQRFSLVSFVWGPGQQTPIHDHTTWGLIGVLEGGEYAQKYVRDGGVLRPSGDEEMLEPGDIDAVSPNLGDIHKVRNARPDATSISIHLYGGNIGDINRHVFDEETGGGRPFRSGYSADVLPNFWS